MEKKILERLEADIASYKPLEMSKKQIIADINECKTRVQLFKVMQKEMNCEFNCLNDIAEIIGLNGN